MTWSLKKKGKRWTFAASIGSLEVRKKNTFWEESNYSHHRRSRDSVVWDKTFLTVLAFLPLTPCPIARFSTVYETIQRSIHRSKISNIKYTYITVDVGAEEKYYKVIWSNPDQFKDVIVHLGGFHAFIHFLVTVENVLQTVGLKRLYTRRECVQWVE